MSMTFAAWQIFLQMDQDGAGMAHGWAEADTNGMLLDSELESLESLSLLSL